MDENTSFDPLLVFTAIFNTSIKIIKKAGRFHRRFANFLLFQLEMSESSGEKKRETASRNKMYLGNFSKGHLPYMGDHYGVRSVYRYKSYVLQYQPRDQHTDQGWKGGQRDEPPTKVRGDAQSGQSEQRATRSRVVADYRIDDTPEQQTQKEETHDPGEFPVCRTKWLRTRFPPSRWLPRRRVVTTVTSRAK